MGIALNHYPKEFVIHYRSPRLPDPLSSEEVSAVLATMDHFTRVRIFFSNVGILIFLGLVIALLCSLNLLFGISIINLAVGSLLVSVSISLVYQFSSLRFLVSISIFAACTLFSFLFSSDPLHLLLVSFVTQLVCCVFVPHILNFIMHRISSIFILPKSCSLIDTCLLEPVSDVHLDELKEASFSNIDICRYLSLCNDMGRPIYNYEYFLIARLYPKHFSEDQYVSVIEPSFVSQESSIHLAHQH